MNATDVRAPAVLHEPSWWLRDRIAWVKATGYVRLCPHAGPHFVDLGARAVTCMSPRCADRLPDTRGFCFRCGQPGGSDAQTIYTLYPTCVVLVSLCAEHAAAELLPPVDLPEGLE